MPMGTAVMRCPYFCAVRPEGDRRACAGRHLPDNRKCYNFSGCIHPLKSKIICFSFVSRSAE